MNSVHVTSLPNLVRNVFFQKRDSMDIDHWKFLEPFDFLALPREIQLIIVYFLDPLDILNASQSCRDVFTLCHQVGLWKYIAFNTWSDIIPNGETLPRDFDWKNYFYLRKLFSSGTLEWKDKNVVHSALPSPRQSLTGNCVNGKVIYVGGQTSFTTRFDDVFVFDPKTRRFTKPHIRGTPPKFARHSACTIGDKLFMFGGYDGHGTFFGLAVFDATTSTWYVPQTGGTAPIPRTNHAVTSLGKNMYLFGGNDTTQFGHSYNPVLATRGSIRYGAYGDFHILNTETMIWEEPPRKGKVPSPRSGHHMIPCGKKIYLFGGGLWNDTEKNWQEKYTDMFAFDTETEEWEEVSQINSPPQSHAFISLPHWGIGPFLFVLSDSVWCFDTVSRKWEEVKVKDGKKPLKRFLGPATYVPRGNSVYVFGGVYASAMNSFDQLTWQPNIFNILLGEKETAPIFPNCTF